MPSALGERHRLPQQRCFSVSEQKKADALLLPCHQQHTRSQWQADENQRFSGDSQRATEYYLINLSVDDSTVPYFSHHSSVHQIRRRAVVSCDLLGTAVQFKQFAGAALGIVVMDTLPRVWVA